MFFRRGSQLTTLKQKDDIGDLLERKPAVVFINPVNWEAIKATLVEVRRKNIPVIMVDATVSDHDLVLSQVSRENFEAGRLACEALAGVKSAARVVILQHSVNKPSIDRVAGFTSALSQHPSMSTLDTLESRGGAESARSAMEHALRGYPQLDAVFAINDPSALGAISAIDADNRAEQVTIVSVDG